MLLRCHEDRLLGAVLAALAQPLQLLEVRRVVAEVLVLALQPRDGLPLEGERLRSAVGLEEDP
eukprot:460305-Alexandrium_andersonii.AAC.1